MCQIQTWRYRCPDKAADTDHLTMGAVRCNASPGIDDPTRCSNYEYQSMGDCDWLCPLCEPLDTLAGKTDPDMKVEEGWRLFVRKWKFGSDLRAHEREVGLVHEFVKWKVGEKVSGKHRDVLVQWNEYVRARG